MISPLLVFLLALVQGLCEFLPISSSGHVLVLEHLLGKDLGMNPRILTLSIFLHGGTLLSTLVFFRKELLDLVTRNRRMLGLLLLASVPTALIGLTLKYALPNSITSLEVTVFGFLTSACCLWFLLRRDDDAEQEDELWIELEPPKPPKPMGPGSALIIGLVQGIAVLPGFSRSGLTISTGSALGHGQRESAVFSFLLAIPAVLGALLLEMCDLAHNPVPIPPTQLILFLAGALVSFLVGLASLSVLMNQLAQGRLYRWAWWLVLVSFVTLFLL